MPPFQGGDRGSNPLRNTSMEHNIIEVFGHVPKVKIVILRGENVLPERRTDGSAGYDLYFNPSDGQDVIIEPGEIKLLETGIAVEPFDNNLFCIVYPRSSMSLKGFYTNPGVIDMDYRGEIKVILTNISKSPLEVKVGNRIGQLLFFYFTKVDFEIVDDLTNTERGSGGFGSTGA